MTWGEVLLLELGQKLHSVNLKKKSVELTEAEGTKGLEGWGWELGDASQGYKVAIR